MQTRAYDIRAATTPLTLEGVAVVFNEPARIGEYTEVIARSALDGVDLADIALLTNHDGASIPLARSPKTLTLTVTERGLEMRAELPDTEQGRAVYEAVRRGDLSQMSFAFDIGEQEFDEVTKTRTIIAIRKVYEISIVNFAAYTQTAVQARGSHENTLTRPGAEATQEVTTVERFNPIESAVFDHTGKGVTNHDPLAAPEYRTAFYKTLLGQTLTEAETRAYNAARAERRADAFNTLTNSAAIVPTHTLNEIIAGLHPQGGLWNEVRHFNVPSNLAVPVGTPADPAEWHIEGMPVDRVSLTTTNVTFTGFELIKIISLSAAAKRMTISAFENYITQELRASIMVAIDAAIVNGTGSGQPQGLLSGITWDTDNSLAVTTNLVDGILGTIALLPAGYANGAKFAMANATLFSSVYPTKTAAGDLVFTQDAQNGSVRRLFGFEIVIDDHIPVGTILFGNFRYYGINMPEGIAIESSRESGFTSGLIDYRALCIADAKPIVPAAFVKLTV